MPQYFAGQPQAELLLQKSNTNQKKRRRTWKKDYLHLNP